MYGEQQNLYNAIEEASKAVFGDEVGMLSNTVVLPFISKMLGWDSNPLMQTYLTNGGTSAGLQNTLLRGQYSEEAARIVKRMRERQRFNAFKVVAKNLYKDKANDNDFLNAKAYGMNGNFLLSSMYDAADPEGFNGVSASMTAMYENTVRPALLQGRSDANAKAAYMVENLFADANGNMDFQKTQYGGFNMRAASQIGAYITAASDMLKGTGDSVDLKQLDTAVVQFRDKIKAFSRAITPLKDLFGDDVGSIIKAVESMSGVSARYMSMGDLSRTSARIADAASTGMFTMQQLSMLSPMVNQQLSAMGVDDYAVRNQGMDIAVRTATALSDMNRTPGGMTDSSYRHFAGNMAVKTAVSKGAGAINNAYAAWLEKNKGGTLEDFRAEMDRRLAAGETVEGAIKDMTGVSSLTELDSYSLSVGASQAASSGLGSDYALVGQKGVLKDRLLSALMYDKGGALAKAGIGSGETAKMLADYEKLLADNPELGSMSMEEFSKQKGVTSKMVAMHGFMMQNREGREYMAMTGMEQGMRKQREMEKTLGSMRAFAESVQGTGEMAEDFSELIKDIISGNETIEGYVKKNTDKQLAMTIGTPAIQKQLSKLTERMKKEMPANAAGAEALIKSIYGDKKKRTSLILADALNKDNLSIEKLSALVGVDDQDALNAAWKSLVSTVGMTQDKATAYLAEHAMRKADGTEGRTIDDVVNLTRLLGSSDKAVSENAKKALLGNRDALGELTTSGKFMSTESAHRLAGAIDNDGRISNKPAMLELEAYEKKYGETKYTKLLNKGDATAEQLKKAYGEAVKGIVADKTGDMSYNHAKASGTALPDLIENLISTMDGLVKSIQSLLTKINTGTK